MKTRLPHIACDVQEIALPPLMSNTALIEKLHSSDASHAASTATSSTLPTRFIGIFATLSSLFVIETYFGRWHSFFPSKAHGLSRPLPLIGSAASNNFAAKELEARAGIEPANLVLQTYIFAAQTLVPQRLRFCFVRLLSNHFANDRELLKIRQHPELRNGPEVRSAK